MIIRRLVFVGIVSVAVGASCEEACGCPPLPPEGYVSIDVRDQNGFPVPGPMATVAGGRTHLGNAAGVIRYRAIIGNQTVRVDVPVPYQVAPEQVNPLRIEVVFNDTTHVLFRAIKPES